MRNKIIALFLLATAITCFYIACKTQKNIQKSSVVTDSTAFHQTSIRENIAIVDTGKAFFLNQLFNISRSSELHIGRISIVEEETAKPSSILRFNIHNLQVHGDTLSTTSEDGAKINIYTDHTGEQVATITPPHGKKTTIDFENVILKSSEQLNANNTLQAERNANLAIYSKAIEKKDSVNAAKSQQNYNKEVTRKPSLFGRFGIIIAIVIVIIIVVIIIKYWKKIKGIFGL